MTRALLAELLRDLEAKRPVVLATELGSGASRLIHPFAGDAGVDPALLAAARDAAQRDTSRSLQTPSGELFLRVFNPPVRVVVIGAVHLAQPLVAMVQLAGYDVQVVDPRKGFATADRFAGVPLAREWPDEALPRLGLDRRTAVVALTHDPKIDDPALAAALRSEAFYVGALGSRKTHQARRQRLQALGFTEGELDRIHGPIGLPLGAVSAGEIAVSILAQLVGCLRRAGEEPGTRA